MAVMITEDLIHPTAVISSEAYLEANVTIGPYAIIDGPARIGEGTIIESHACLTGPLMMGRDNYVGHGAILGKAPQHRGYRGESTELRIGDDNVFREYVTIHRGTVDGGGITLIGDRNVFMVGSHIGHDAKVGNGCTLVNGALVAGHVELHDGCLLSGHTGIQQRVRVGRLAMLGGLATTSKDVPPFILQQGHNCVSGLNLIGLRRAGFSHHAIDALRNAFRIIYHERLALHNAIEKAQTEFGECSEVEEFLTFIRQSTIGINLARELHPQRRV